MSGSHTPLRLPASVPPGGPGCPRLARSPAFYLPDIWGSALHFGAGGVVGGWVGQAWIKAFSPSKGPFFPKGGGRDGGSGVSALLPTAPQTETHVGGEMTSKGWRGRGCGKRARQVIPCLPWQSLGLCPPWRCGEGPGVWHLPPQRLGRGVLVPLGSGWAETPGYQRGTAVTSGWL